jgi:L-lysine exporter family protein LysE/ArgO
VNTAIWAGFGLGLSLIVAIGAQNAYVLQTGIRRHGLAAVVTVCIVSDVALICAGVAGVGAAVAAHPAVLGAVKWLGVAVLIGYGLRALWSARRTESLPAEPSAEPDDPNGGGLATVSRVRATGRTALAGVPLALALTWLNPHVYLDTVLLLGSSSTRFGADRWWFALGAAVASALWFTGLGYGARSLADPLSRPQVWRAINIGIGLLILLLAARLAVLPIQP